MKKHIIYAMTFVGIAMGGFAQKKPTKTESPDTSFSRYQQENSNDVAGSVEANMAKKVGDTSFVVKAIKANQEEVRMAELAEKKSKDTAVKKVAANVKTDRLVRIKELFTLHKKSSKPVNPADSSKNIDKTKAAGDSIINDRTKELTDEMQELNNMSGTEFDRHWTEMMIQKNKETIAEYERELATTKEKEVKDFIQEALPKIKEHQQELMKLTNATDKTKVSSRTNNK
jgi:putative membrane protein